MISDELILRCCNQLGIQFNILTGVYNCEEAMKLLDACSEENLESENEYNYFITMSQFFKNFLDEDEDYVITFVQFIDVITQKTVMMPILLNDGEQNVVVDALVQICDVVNEWDANSVRWLIERPNTPICEVIRRECLGNVLMENIRAFGGSEMREVRRLLTDFF
jgi:hypothetical protein